MNPFLHITGLEGKFEIIVSLNMHAAMNFKILEIQLNGMHIITLV
jgi:hypothetical protein